MYPSDYRYTKATTNGSRSGKGSVGNHRDHCDYAQQELGDVVFAELPKVGAQMKSGESFCTFESVKAVSDIFSPVYG